MCNARAARAQLGGLTDAFEYIEGHAGHVGNEYVDRLAKWGATHFRAACGLCRPLATVLFWLGQNGRGLPWAATALRCFLGDPMLPPLCTSDLGHDRNHAGLSHAALLRPFVPFECTSEAGEAEHAQPSTTPSSESLSMTLTIVSFNALSLLPGERQEAGLAYQVGASAILAEQLLANDVSIAMIQESRCPPGKVKTGSYTRLCSGAERGQWGVEVWLRDGCAVLTHASGQAAASVRAVQATVLAADPRRLLVRILCKPMSFLLVALHGPHRAFERSHILIWWKETIGMIRHYLKNDVLIVAGDLNAALGSRPTAAVDTHAAETEDTAGECVQDLMEAFQLFCPSTFCQLHQGASFTYYQKKCDPVCRVDYILVPRDWQSSHVASSTLPCVHAGHAVQDHVAVCTHVEASLRAEAASLPWARGRIRAPHIMDSGCRAQIVQVLRTAPVVPWGVSTHAHAAIITEHVQRGLTRIQGKKTARPRHPHLSGDTWALQQLVARARHALHFRKARLEHHRLLACLQVWRSRTLTFEQAFANHRWVRQVTFLQAIQVSHLDGLSRALKKSCRLDRDRYIEGLADAISSGPSDGVFAALHAILAHKRKKPYKLEPLPRLKKPDGSACQGPDEVKQVWRRHFGNLEAGVPTSLEAIARAAAEGTGVIANLPRLTHPEDISMIASHADVIQVLRGTKTAKSPGFDALPPELCRAFSQEMAILLHPLLLKTAWRGEEPIGWKGGKAVYFYKNRGEHDSPSSYRAVLLLSTWAKVNHKCLRPPLKSHFERTAPPYKWEEKQVFPLCLGLTL